MANSARQAASIIAETADELFGWDAFACDLIASDKENMEPVLCLDVIDGKRREVRPEISAAGMVSREVAKRGARLILRRMPPRFSEGTLPFGDTSRPSASLMYVPLRTKAGVVGVLSIQSYTPKAYNQEHLKGLQALADHCAGALARVRIAEENEVLHERLLLAFAAGHMATWTIDLLNGGRVLPSPELEMMLGINPGEFRGGQAEMLEWVHPDDRPLVQRSLAEAIGGKDDYDVQFRVLPRNRPAGWLLGRGRLYRDANGQPVRLAGVVIDITRQKLAEQEILLLNAELERRVAQRTQQLEATNKELEAFCYSVSHDLRAPLRTIRGFTELLVQRHAEGLNPRGLEFLQRTCEASQQMDKLIEGLLALSRIGRSELRRQRVNLSQLTQGLLEELRRADPGRAARFTVAADIEVEGDERLLRIVLDNLLRNAWKFTGRQPKAEIEFGVVAQPERTFYVRDNGAGFDMAYAGRLFAVFQRLHSAAEFPGSGVGLATVQRIVARHGGRVWAEAKVAKGATFYFTLGMDTLKASIGK